MTDMPSRPRFYRVEEDELAGMTYVHLREGAAVARTVDHDPVFIDYDNEGNVVGFELFGLLHPHLTKTTVALTFPDHFTQPTITAENAHYTTEDTDA